MFKREVWIDRKMAATNLEIVKTPMARILLTLHVGLEMEITVTLFLILLNDNKLKVSEVGFCNFHSTLPHSFSHLVILEQ